jgi:hypothetical protein
MKLRDAVSRCKFTIANGNKPNQTDVEAYNMVLEFLHKTQEKTIQENLLFAKLYTFVLSGLTDQYGDVNFANKQLNKILSEPIDIRIQMLLMKLKHAELSQSISDPMLEGKTEEELKEVFQRYPKFAELFQTCWDHWDKDSVTGYLNMNINLSLHEYKNNV